MKKIEILAPAGNTEAFYAAINSGADAIYLGGNKFGARSYADNFSISELQELINYAHLFDVKVYCTVNTIIFEDELEEVLDFVGDLHKIGIDAILVQDFGLLNMVRKVYPNLSVHASTQMNVSTVEEVKALKELGVERVVLARETPIEVIKEIKSQVDIEIEVFAHGAICISYSGNCLMSSVVCKRSGNRGKCAGSCRLQYKLDDGEYRYLLSSKDLMTIDNVKELIEAGVDSLKIEGRMKRKEYVSQVVSSYRKAVNNYYNPKEEIDLPKEKKKLKLIFNREFSKGFIFSDKNSNIVNSNQPNHIGVLIGEVISSSGYEATIMLSDDLNYNDSIRIVGKETDAITINQIKVNGVMQKHASKNEVCIVKTHVKEIGKGLVYKTTDGEQLKELNEINPPIIDISGKVYLENNNLYFEITDGKHTVIDSIIIDDEANSNYNERIVAQLKKCGPLYRLQSLQNNLSRQVFIQVSKINGLRRSVLDKLTSIRQKLPREYQKNIYSYEKKHLERLPLHLTARVRTLEQLEECLKMGIEYIYVCDYQLYLNNKDKANIYYYPPRIGNDKIAEHKVISTIKELNNQNISVYANVCNSISLYELVKRNVQTIGLSVELDNARLEQLILNYQERFGDLPNLEYMVYGRYELMVTKYCLINDYYGYKSLQCNECLKQQHFLTDKNGYKFPLVREENCNLRILNSKITNLLNYLPTLINLKINSLLLDFTIESKEEVNKVVSDFQTKLVNKYYTDSKNSDYTYGHFVEGVK